MHAGLQAPSDGPSAKRPRSSSEDVDVEAEAREGNVRSEVFTLCMHIICDVKQAKHLRCIVVLPVCCSSLKLA